MNSPKTVKTTIIALTPLLLAFLIAGCDGVGDSSNSSNQLTQNASNQPNQPNQLQQLDGKDIYRGFMFGQGEVASMFPEVFDETGMEALSDEKLSKVASQRIEGITEKEIRQAYQKSQELSPEKRQRLTNNLIAKLSDRIQKNNPNFFDRFERRMKSGNHLKVQRALTSMAEVTIPALANMLNVSEDVLRGNEPFPQKAGLGRGQCVWAVAWVVAVGAVTVAGAVNAAVNVNVVYNVNQFWGSVERQPTSGLHNEMVVNLITKRLAV